MLRIQRLPSVEQSGQAEQSVQPDEALAANVSLPEGEELPGVLPGIQGPRAAPSDQSWADSLRRSMHLRRRSPTKRPMIECAVEPLLEPGHSQPAVDLGSKARSRWTFKGMSARLKEIRSDMKHKQSGQA